MRHVSHFLKWIHIKISTPIPLFFFITDAFNMIHSILFYLIGACKGCSLENEGTPCSWDPPCGNLASIYGSGSEFIQSPVSNFISWSANNFTHGADRQQHGWAGGLRRIRCCNPARASARGTRLRKMAAAIAVCLREIWSGWRWVHHAGGAHNGTHPSLFSIIMFLLLHDEHGFFPNT